jgi:ABC-type branched-subunit amino acid transport system substrate-binding protein
LKPITFLALTAALLAGCQFLIGLEPRELEANNEPVDAGSDEILDAGCRHNAECEQPDASFICVKSTGQCVNLFEGGCRETFGADWASDESILFSVMLALQGSQAPTNQARINGAKLAVSEINRYGGVPGPNGRRPITLLICDATTLLDAGAHLANELKVASIIGPNFSQDTIDLTSRITAQAGVVVMTPASLAASIASLDDHDFTWRTIPSDLQRGPLLVRRVNDLEADLHDAGVAKVRFAMLARNDAFGAGTALSVNQTLKINGAGLTDPANATSVFVRLYDATQPNQNTVTAELVAFKPDIVVCAGTAEAVTQIVAPFEAALDGGVRRPFHLFLDSSRTTDLLTLVGDAGVRYGLRERVSGTGVSPTPESRDNMNNFIFGYKTFTNNPSFPNVSGMAQTYDSVYAISYALAYFRNEPVTGANLVRGLRRLSTGSGQVFNTGLGSIQSVFSAIELGSTVSLRGTMGPVEFDSNGDIIGSQIEVWCISRDQGAGVAYGTAGQTYNTKTGTFAGTYAPCP